MNWLKTFRKCWEITRILSCRSKRSKISNSTAFESSFSELHSNFRFNNWKYWKFNGKRKVFQMKKWKKNPTNPSKNQESLNEKFTLPEFTNFPEIKVRWFTTNVKAMIILNNMQMFNSFFYRWFFTPNWRENKN